MKKVTNSRKRPPHVTCTTTNHDIRDRSENITVEGEACEGRGCPDFAIHWREGMQILSILGGGDQILRILGGEHPDFAKH